MSDERRAAAPDPLLLAAAMLDVDETGWQVRAVDDAEVQRRLRELEEQRGS